MPKILVIAFIISATLAISCTTKSEKEVPVLELKDLIVDTLYLEKDTITKDLGENFNYYKTDSGEVLVTFLNNQLRVYSYPQGKQLRKQLYEKEGPDGIGSFISQSFVDMNNLYVFSQQQELIQCDFEGKVLNRWDFPEVSETRKY